MQVESIIKRIDRDIETISPHSKKIEYLRSYYNRLCNHQNNSYVLEAEKIYTDNDPVINSVSSWDIPEIQTWIQAKILEIEKKKKRYGLTIFTAFDISPGKEKQFIKMLQQMQNEKLIELEKDIRSGGRIILLSKSKRKQAVELYKKFKSYMSSELSNPWVKISTWFIYRESGKIKNFSPKKLSDAYIFITKKYSD